MKLHGPIRLLVLALSLPLMLTCNKKSSDDGSGATSVTYKYFLYAANSGSNDVSTFSMDSNTGLLTMVGSNVPAHTTPLNVAGGGGSAPFLYVLNSGSTDISGYSVNTSTGALTALAGSPFATGAAGAQSITATANFVYAAAQSANKVYGFSINQSTGALTPVGNWATGNNPVDLVVVYGVSSQYLYVANNGGTIDAFSINAGTGALTELAGAPYTAGTSPNGLTAAPGYLFAAVTGGSEVGIWSIDSTTGALTPVPGEPFGVGYGSSVVGAYPIGQFVYLQGGATSIVGGVLNGSGVPGAMSGSPFNMAAGPNGGFAFDPTLKFMYAHGGDGNIYGFGINGITGALTALSTPSFAAGTGAGGVRSMIMGQFAQ